MAWWRGRSGTRPLLPNAERGSRTADRIREIPLKETLVRRSLETRVLACCVVGLVALSPAATSAAPAEFDHRKLAETARTRFIIPGYSQFGRRLNALKQAIAALCMSPSQPGLDEARASYRQTIAAWGRIEIISFGPVAEQNRFERILYWPDRKGRGSRQVRRLLAKKNRTPSRLAALRPKALLFRAWARSNSCSTEPVPITSQ